MATCLPVLFSVAIQTTPVEPSPIFTNRSNNSRGFPCFTTFCKACRNCSCVTGSSAYISLDLEKSSCPDISSSTGSRTLSAPLGVGECTCRSEALPSCVDIGSCGFDLGDRGLFVRGDVGFCLSLLLVPLGFIEEPEVLPRFFGFFKIPTGGAGCGLAVLFVTSFPVPFSFGELSLSAWRSLKEVRNEFDLETFIADCCLFCSSTLKSSPKNWVIRLVSVIASGSTIGFGRPSFEINCSHCGGKPTNLPVFVS